MKWLSNLFLRKKEETQSRITPEDAERLLEEKTKPWQEELSSLLSDIYAGIKEKKAALAGSNTRLEKAQVLEEIHSRLLKAALTNRENITKQISAITSAIRTPDGTDYATALEFYGNSSRTIAECTQRSTVSYQYVKLVFEEESREVRQKAKELEEAFISLKKELDSRREFFDRASSAKEKILGIRKITGEKQEQEKKAEQAEEKREQMKKGLEETKKRLGLLLAGDEYTGFEKAKAGILAAEAELRANREKAASLISPVERVLKKYRKAAEDGKTRYANLKVIDRYLAGPADALLSDKDLDICTIAVEIRGLAGTGEIEKDLKRTEKVLQSLNDIKPEKIRTMQLRNGSLSLKKASLEKKMSESRIEPEKKALEGETGRISGHIREIEAEAARAKNAALQADGEIKKGMESLAEIINGFTGESTRVE